jgi:hypothetical protein
MRDYKQESVEERSGPHAVESMSVLHVCADPLT